MSDYDMGPDGPRGNPADDKDRTIAIVIYILYLLGFGGALTAVVGVALAHSKTTHDPLWRSHFDYQIRTFWLGFATLVVGGILSLVIIGYLILAWWALWTVIRVVKGLMLAINSEPVDDPQTLWW